MFELIKKSILAGIGAVVVTRDKVMEATRNLVQEGKISTDEAERLAEELIRSGERQWEEINSKSSETFKRWMDGLDLARRKEVDQLKARVDVLEQRLLILETAHRCEQGGIGEH